MFHGPFYIPSQKKHKKYNKYIDPDTLPIDNLAVKELVKQLGECLSTFRKSLIKIKANLNEVNEETENPATIKLINHIIEEVIDDQLKPQYTVNEIYEDILKEQHNIEINDLQTKRKRERSVIFDN